MSTANNRLEKRALLYDGHARKAGVSAHNRELKWRRWRRRMALLLRRERGAV